MHSTCNQKSISNLVFVLDAQEMLNLATANITRQFKKKTSLLPEKFVIANVGRQDAKKHLEEHFSNLMSSNVVQTLETSLYTVAF